MVKYNYLLINKIDLILIDLIKYLEVLHNQTINSF